MAGLTPALQKLVFELSKLPSIGEKSATRLAYHIVSRGREHAPGLAQAINIAISQVQWCQNCFALAEAVVCPVCLDEVRDQSVICLVEKPTDLIAIERIGDYKGIYHVLHGLWAPLRGVSTASLRLSELLLRVSNGQVREVILALNSTVEGDATALYISKLLAERGIKSTRLAQGLSKGSELEYADDVTLARAFAGRNVV